MNSDLRTSLSIVVGPIKVFDLIIPRNKKPSGVKSGERGNQAILGERTTSNPMVGKL